MTHFLVTEEVPFPMSIVQRAASIPRYRLAAAVGVLALGGLVGWQLTRPGPELGYVKALGAIDAALGQQWGSLPKATQEALSATYGRVGLTPPPQRR